MQRIKQYKYPVLHYNPPPPSTAAHLSHYYIIIRKYASLHVIMLSILKQKTCATYNICVGTIEGRGAIAFPVWETCHTLFPIATPYIAHFCYRSSYMQRESTVYNYPFFRRGNIFGQHSLSENIRTWYM